MNDHFSWSDLLHRLTRQEGKSRGPRARRTPGGTGGGSQVARRPSAWIGLEGLEQRTLLSTSLQVLGGASQTVLIANNDTTPSQVDSTNLGEAALGGDVYRRFWIKNTSGSEIDLTGALVTITGTNKGDFSIPAAEMPVAAIPAGQEVNFGVHFDPTTAGLRKATINLTSNDPGGGTYTFAVQGAALAVTTMADGLQYAVTTPGTGKTVVAGDNLLVNYTGYLTDGSVFDSSLNAGRYPFSITGIGTASLITGWNEGLIGMKVGETRALIVPSDLGYGSAGSPPSIPADATLIFDVTLLSDGSTVRMAGGSSYQYAIDDSQQPAATGDHTDFGNVVLTGGTASWNFALANSGITAVHLTGATRAVIGGPNASDFKVTTQPPASIAAPTTAGNSSLGEFTIQFDPSALGLRKATVTLVTDSPNEGSYTFSIQGTGAPNHLTGATENQPFAITYATLYKAVYGITAPATGGVSFRIQSIDSGTLTSGGAAVVPGTTLIGTGKSLVWTPNPDANHTQDAFTIQPVTTAGVMVGSAMPVYVEVTAASDAPVFTGTLNNLFLRPSAIAQSSPIDLTGMFSVPTLTGQLVKFDTSLGAFYIDTFTNTPTTTNNFLTYVTSGAYSSTIINSVTAGSLVQGGEYSLSSTGQVGFVTTNSPVDMEYGGYSNVAGTVSVWRSSWAANGTTTGFTFNAADNSAARDGDYAVIGRVMGAGMNVVNAISKLPTKDLHTTLNADFSKVPLISGTNAVMVTSVSEVSGLGITLSVTSSNPSIVAASLTGDTLNLDIPANASGGATITVTATDDTGLSTTKTFSVLVPGVSITAAATTSAAVEPTATKAATNGVFTLTRTGPTTASLDVQYTLGGTAVNTRDYATLSGTATIPAGKASVTVTVAPVDNGLVTATQTVTATLVDDASLPYGVTSANSATVSIANRDLPTVSIVSTANASETDTTTAGYGAFTLNFTPAEIDIPVTVTLTRSGTAVSGADYTLMLGSTVLGASATIIAPTGPVTLNVVPIARTGAVPDKAVTVTLGTSTAYLLGAKAATLTILGNLPRVSIVASDSSATKAALPADLGEFTVTRTGSTALPLTVTLTRTGTAVSGTDFAALPTSVVIPAGAASADVWVQPLADATGTQPIKAVTLTLGANSNYALAVLPADRTATVSITDSPKNPAADPVLLTLTYTGKTYSLAALAGQTLTVTAQVRNQGLAATTGPVQIDFVLSKDGVIGNGDDVSLGSAIIPSLTAGQTSPASYKATMTALTGLAIGNYFVFAEIDLGSSVIYSPLNNIVIVA